MTTAHKMADDAVAKSKRAQKDERDLVSFLSKVDELESIVRGITKNDDTAIQRADEFLAKHNPPQEEGTKRPFNRTVINDAPSKHDVGDPTLHDPTAAGFMAAMEKDCEERAERRKVKEAEANVLKESGNREFNAGNFELAVEQYTKALACVKYWSTLYTNRAQAYLRLGRCQEAIEDCSWAFRAEEHCLKAYILQGKAYLALKDYNKAVDSYQQALLHHPSKAAVISEYVARTRLSEVAEREERSAAELFDVGDDGACGLVGLMNKTCRPGQRPIYYTGGLGFIKSALSTASNKVLFRTHGGLQWTKVHPVISKCFMAVGADVVLAAERLSEEEGLMCATYLGVLQEACKQCETNEEEVLELADLIDQLLSFTEAGSGHEVARAAVSMLHQLSTSERGRASLCSKCNVARLIACVFSKLQTDADLAITGVGLLCNMALDKKFKVQGFDQFEGTISTGFESFLNVGGAKNLSLAALCFTFLTTCCVVDKHMRAKLAQRDATWSACMHTLSELEATYMTSASAEDALGSALSLLACLSLEPARLLATSLLPCAASELTTLCIRLVMEADSPPGVRARGGVRGRALVLLNRLLAVDVSVVEGACGLGLVPTLLRVIQEDEASSTKQGTIGLTACTQRSEEARQQIVSAPKGVATLLKLLKHADDSVVGNAALCLGYCVASSPKAGRALVKSDVIKELLVSARDQSKPTVQHNCAILIAKLAASHSAHLARLRELHGLEILHTVLQHVKDP